MPNLNIENFAKVVINEVRDRAIASCDMQLTTEVNSPIAKRWRQAIASNSPKDLVSAVIPDCVDEVLFYLFHAIDSGLLQLSYIGESGRAVNLAAQGRGELAGWYMGSDGWRAQYSKERFVDDFADLK